MTENETINTGQTEMSDLSSTSNSDMPNKPPDDDSCWNAIQVSVTPEDYLQDVEFHDLYVYKSTGVLPREDNDTCKVTLTHDYH